MNLYFAFQKSEKWNIEQSISHSTTIVQAVLIIVNVGMMDLRLRSLLKRDLNIYTFLMHKKPFFHSDWKDGVNKEIDWPLPDLTALVFSHVGIWYQERDIS